MNARQRSLREAVGETPSTRRLLSRVSASCTALPVPDTTHFHTQAHLHTLRLRTSTHVRPGPAHTHPQASTVCSAGATGQADNRAHRGTDTDGVSKASVSSFYTLIGQGLRTQMSTVTLRCPTCS